MKEYLNQARQLYMDLWAFHLDSLLDYLKMGDREGALKRAGARSMELGKKYERTDIGDFARRRVVDVMDEIERAIKVNETWKVSQEIR